jgi:hypothetical protein
MTVEQLVEEMEENEDTVECKHCEELFDKNDCRHVLGFGWLCGDCQSILSSKEEPLVFTDEYEKELEAEETAAARYYDRMEQRGKDITKHGASIEEAMDPRDMVELEYTSLTVTLYGKKRAEDDWDEMEHTDSHVFLVPKIEVATAIWENWLTEEDVTSVEGGLEALENDDAWESFLESHFDELFEKYEQQILAYFEDEATEDFRERAQTEYQLDQLYGNSDQAYDELRDSRLFRENKEKPFLEEFDSAEDHKACLTDCPECGTVSYDMKEQYCTNCGLNL